MRLRQRTDTLFFYSQPFYRTSIARHSCDIQQTRSEIAASSYRSRIVLVTTALPLSERHFSSIFLAGHELNNVWREIGAKLDVGAAVTADLVVVRRREYRQQLRINNNLLNTSGYLLLITCLFIHDLGHRLPNGKLKWPSYQSIITFYRVFQKSRPPETLWNIFIKVKSFCVKFCKFVVNSYPHIPNNFYLAIQRSVWRDIKFVFLFVCTVEDISTQDGVIGVKFWLRVEQTPGTGTRQFGDDRPMGAPGAGG